MPTSTDPYQVTLDFINDTDRPQSLQVENGASSLIPARDNVLLVLIAGSVYKYHASLDERSADLVVIIWEGAQLNLTDVFPSTGYHAGLPTVVTVKKTSAGQLSVEHEQLTSQPVHIQARFSLSSITSHFRYARLVF